MSKKLVNIRLFGELGQQVGQSWDLSVKSLGEGLRFIESISNKLYKTLLEFDKKNVKYQVIINGRNFKTDKELITIKDIQDSELCIKNKNLETVDIVPVLEGADSGVFTGILGAVLIAASFFSGPLGPIVFTAGLTLLAAGVYSLLARPPKFEDFREIEQGGKTSYLFSGPQNIIGEGGPVPVGYGRLLVGSQVISSAYVIRDYNTADTSDYIRDEYGGLTFIPKKKATPKSAWRT